MQYVLAFIIFLIVINVIGLIFSFLWPFILALIVVVAILNWLAYRKRKKAMEEFYQDFQQEQSFDDFFHNDDNTSSSNDDVIDVEFTETDADDER